MGYLVGVPNPGFIDCFFGQFAFFRKLLGGHWERWHIRLIGYDGHYWYRVDRCYDGCCKPSDLCFGKPECEDHGPTTRSGAIPNINWEWRREQRMAQFREMYEVQPKKRVTVQHQGPFPPIRSDQ